MSVSERSTPLRRGLVLLALSVAGFCCRTAIAQSASKPADEYLNRIKTYQTVQPLGEKPFGESVNFLTGELSFNQTDLVVQGQGPDIVIERRLFVGSRISKDGFRPGMANWEFVVPQITTILPNRTLPSAPYYLPPKWMVGYDATNDAERSQRCSKFYSPTWGQGVIGEEHWWTGYQMLVPGAGKQELLARYDEHSMAPTDKPLADYPALTNANWQISCKAATANGFQGEAFQALSPDGVRYTFDHVAFYQVDTIYRNVHDTLLASSETPPEEEGTDPELGTGDDPQPITSSSEKVHQYRERGMMMVTRIEDRFGNYISYVYDSSDRLDHIVGYDRNDNLDGRLVEFTYTNDGLNRVKTIAVVNGSQRRTYTYAYDATHLLSVTQPDGSTWDLSGVPNVQGQNWSGVDGDYRACETVPVGSPNANLTTISMTHPSGLQGSFALKNIWHGRTKVAYCGWDIDNNFTGEPTLYTTRSLTSKTFSGPGLANDQLWTYTYSPARGSTGITCDSSNNYCTAWIDVKDPASNVNRYTISTQYNNTEARIETIQYGLTGSAALRTESLTYAAATQGPYPAIIGFAWSPGNVAGLEVWTPVNSRTITQQGKTFTWQATAFDPYGNPKAVTKSSSLGTQRKEDIGYYTNTDLWVLGQVWRVRDVTNASNPIEMSKTGYNQIYALPSSTYAFGVLQNYFYYNPDGTLKMVRDGLLNDTKLQNHKRGIPQKIIQADGKYLTAVVNGFGQLDSVTDQMGSTTSYLYDSMGRLKQTDYPTGDSTNWAPSRRVFRQLTAADPDYGLTAANGTKPWVIEETTGNGRTNTYLDAFWRPVVTLQQDKTQGVTVQRFTVTRHENAVQSNNASGTATYASDFNAYPVASLSNYRSSTLKGVRTSYDALGRPHRVEQNSEIGTLATRYLYPNGDLKTQVINPREKVTTTYFTAWDQPSTNLPRKILQPESVTTDFFRDAWGKPTGIKRSGAGKTLERRFVYDDNQRLCMRYDPESNWSVFAYNAAGSIDWSASGQTGISATETACKRASILDAVKNFREYDELQRVTKIDFASPTDDSVFTYYDDGALETQTTGTGYTARTWTYTYNKRRMPMTESLSVAGKAFDISYTYRALGLPNTMTYPDGTQLSMKNIWLGYQDDAGIYAANVQHHPNGQLASFNYGNGAQFNQLLNMRGLPDRRTDSRTDSSGTSKYIDYGYVYDENANLVDLADYGLSDSRSMEYDGLDRLTGVVGPMYDPAFEGNANFYYDTLDNLRQWTISPPSGGVYVNDYGYNTKNQLEDAVQTGPGFTLPLSSYSYTNRGEMLTRGNGHATFVHQYDATGRMTTAGADDGTSEVYRYDGNGHRTYSTNASGQKRYEVFNRAGQRVYVDDQWEGYKARYIYLDNRLVAEVRTQLSNGASNTYYYHTDHLGTATVRTDNLGLIQQTQFRTTFGRLFGGEVAGPGYAGHIGDSHTDLTYMKARYYDNLAKRFVSTDPVDVDAGSGANFNRYWYANNNPYRFIDPDGREPQDNWYGLNDQRFRDWVHAEKQLEGRGGAQNYSKADLKRLFQEWKELGEPRGKGGTSGRGGRQRGFVVPAWLLKANVYVYLITHTEDLNAGEQEALENRRQEAEVTQDQPAEGSDKPTPETSKAPEKEPEPPPKKEQIIERFKSR